jgi:hypothetical protein
MEVGIVNYLIKQKTIETRPLRTYHFWTLYCRGQFHKSLRDDPQAGMGRLIEELKKKYIDSIIP